MCFKPHSSFQSPPFFMPEYLIKETRQVRQQLRDQTLQTTIYSMESATQMTFTTYSRFSSADDDNCVNYDEYKSVSHVHNYYYILNISFPSILWKKYFTHIQKIMLAVPFCEYSNFASAKETWPIYIHHIFNCALVSLEILLQLQFQHNFDYNSWSEANLATSHAMCQMWGDFAR